MSGIILAADIRGADANNAGLWLELDAILAVVLAGASLAGGRIYLLLTIVGVLIIQTLTTAILTSGLPAQYNLVVKATIILAVLLIQSPKTRQWLSGFFSKNKNAGKSSAGEYITDKSSAKPLLNNVICRYWQPYWFSSCCTVLACTNTKAFVTPWCFQIY